MPLRLRSADPDATAAIGRAVAGLLLPGDVLLLVGPLGAGKTRMVQGIAAGLGVAGRVTSPTFVLVRRHEARIPLVHVDAYRLGEARDLLALDDEVLDPSVVTCIEWGEIVRDALPDDRLECHLRIAGDDAGAPRAVTFEPFGPTWTRRAAELRTRCVQLVDATAALELVSVGDDA